LEGFRDASFQILVATDIAARGIDVSTISHVINYDMPDTVDAYTHRIGRTGRAARTGDAFTLVTREDEPLVREIERTLGAKLDRRKVAGFDYAAPAPKRDAEFARPPRQPHSAGPARAGRAKAGAPSSSASPPRAHGPTAATPSKTARRFSPSRRPR
jgi:ATP-dependent RNA helicase RhlE